MTGPSVVSVARIEPELARRSWGRVQLLVTGDGPGNASGNLRCFIAVFGHGDGLPETIERVRRILAAGTPDRLRPHIAVQAALSSEPSADTPGTLYVNWLFEPGTPDELMEDIYIHTLPLAIFGALWIAPKARVTWPRDDEIAARVITAAVPPRGAVSRYTRRPRPRDRPPRGRATADARAAGSRPPVGRRCLLEARWRPLTAQAFTPAPIRACGALRLRLAPSPGRV